ncbi:hypothetical protein [Paraburkholderia sp. J67]|uniref:hypothetical protein n=1 Tax=Paraburkholderia sp. J67 TaxID=2805435 RepID=UPI002ABDA91D|nr:hypothetical protein [Paraburkholderia sp. J67]
MIQHGFGEHSPTPGVKRQIEREKTSTTPFTGLVEVIRMTLQQRKLSSHCGVSERDRRA